MEIPEFLTDRDRYADADGWASYPAVVRWYNEFVREYPPRRAFELAYERALVESQEGEREREIQPR